MFISGVAFPLKGVYPFEPSENVYVLWIFLQVKRLDEDFPFFYYLYIVLWTT